MNLECFRGIITDNLAIQIDLTQLKSWDLNTGFTAYSLTKWAGAVSDNINLIDFGLTEFDNGRTNIMWSGITLTPSDTLFSMYRVGYNVVQNPTSGNTSGYTATTTYSGYSISAVTSSTIGNYFELNGGYLQGFFKLQDYNYQLLPSRFNNGITIETLLYINSSSYGTFYMMGLRAEDKYNPYFSGETTITGEVISGTTFAAPSISGVKTSENNYLNAYYEVLVNKRAFKTWETRKRVEYIEAPPIDNIKNNVIAFSLTSDDNLSYKYVDANGLIVENTSTAKVPVMGWTLIAISYIPDSILSDSINYDPTLLDCSPRRTGKLIFYVNGRPFWTVKDFPEYYFKALKNQREKQIGVPYSISWGGGSFGLKYSYHYDYQKYSLYTEEDTSYINDNFWVQNDPIPYDCEPTPSDDYLSGLLLSADTTTFTTVDICDPSIHNPLTVMRITYTGTTGNTGGTASKYFIKYNHPITVLSNRDYNVNLSFYNSGFFNTYDVNNYYIYSHASIVVYGSVDVDIINEVLYSYPLTEAELLDVNATGLHPFPDREEYEYIYLNHMAYYGATGIPVTEENSITSGLIPSSSLINGYFVTGENGWKTLNCIFRTKENTGKQTVYIGLLLESTSEFNKNIPLFINNFTYEGADILSQDPRKDPLLIEQNFNSSFIGGIQKLRVYNKGLTSPEILHNAITEARYNPFLDLRVSRGGRIIYAQRDIPYSPPETSGSDMRLSIKYRNTDGSYKNEYQMLDIKVVVKSRTNPSVELVKFKKVGGVISGETWLALIYVNDFTYDFIVPNTITGAHPNEILFAEIEFSWTDPLDIDNVFDKIFVTNITTSLLDNSVKNY